MDYRRRRLKGLQSERQQNGYSILLERKSQHTHEWNVHFVGIPKSMNELVCPLCPMSADIILGDSEKKHLASDNIMYRWGPAQRTIYEVVLYILYTKLINLIHLTKIQIIANKSPLRNDPFLSIETTAKMEKNDRLRPTNEGPRNFPWYSKYMTLW